MLPKRSQRLDERKLAQQLLDAVNWKSLGQEKFDRCVEALLIRKYQTVPGLTAEALDGRGGDGGIDVAVYRDDVIEHIYQLKFFPEGFVGEWAKARKPQIQKSFDAAMKHSPLKWTLVIPGNPTATERKHVKDLALAFSVRTHVMGRGELDAELSLHADLQHLFLREPLMEKMKSLSLERLMLEGPGDLRDVVSDVSERLDARSAAWATDFANINGVHTETYRAKVPNAHEIEPLRFNMNLAFGPGQDKDRKRFQRFLDFGVTDGLKIDGNMVHDFQKVGPSWFADTEGMTIKGMEIRDVEPTVNCLAEVAFVHESGVTQSSFAGKMTKTSSAAAGRHYRFEFPGGLVVEADVYFPGRSDGQEGALTFSLDHAGHPVRDALRANRLYQNLLSGSRAVFRIDGRDVFSATRPFPALDSELSTWNQYIEDLDVIGRMRDIDFVAPEDVSEAECQRVHTARLLMEGACVSVDVRAMAFPISSADRVESLETLVAVGGPVCCEPQDLSISVLGRPINVGKVLLHHQSAVVANGDAVLEGIKNDEGETFIHVEPGDGTPFRLVGSDFAHVTSSECGVELPILSDEVDVL